jgi:hypothetical protein
MNVLLRGLMILLMGERELLIATKCLSTVDSMITLVIRRLTMDLSVSTIITCADLTSAMIKLIFAQLAIKIISVSILHKPVEMAFVSSSKPSLELLVLIMMIVIASIALIIFAEEILRMVRNA